MACRGGNSSLPIKAQYLDVLGVVAAEDSDELAFVTRDVRVHLHLEHGATHGAELGHLTDSQIVEARVDEFADVLKRCVVICAVRAVRSGAQLDDLLRDVFVHTGNHLQLDGAGGVNVDSPGRERRQQIMKTHGINNIFAIHRTEIEGASELG